MYRLFVFAGIVVVIMSVGAAVSAGASIRTTSLVFMAAAALVTMIYVGVDAIMVAIADIHFRKLKKR